MKPLLKELNTVEKQGLVKAVCEIARSADYLRYYEPYFTTGLVLCGLGLEQAPLAGVSFMNNDTLLFYKMVVEQTSALYLRVNELAERQDGEWYSQLRTHFNQLPEGQSVERAALFYFLNRTCNRGAWYDEPDSDVFTRPFGYYCYQDPFINGNDLLAWSGRIGACLTIYPTPNDLLIAAECNRGLVYLDPPNVYRTAEFYQRVRGLKCPWILLSDGIPEQLKAKHVKAKKLLQPRFVLLYSYGSQS